jgi:branched-chain amino acid transport system permease protein
MQFTDYRVYIVVALVLLVIALLASLAVERSRFGMALTAIRQNEPAAEAAGIDTLRWKMRAIVLSGALAAATGGLYAVVLLVVTPQTVFGMLTSAQALVVTLFGGIGTLWGPLIGAAILVPLNETLQARLGNIIPGIQGVVYGTAVILVILLAPEGLFWRVRDRVFVRPAARARDARPSVGSAPVQRVQSAVRNQGGALLEVSDLSRSFGGLQAVEGVSFTVHEGAILGIIGPNGAGKTTLFNLLNGFTQPDRGHVRFEGHDVIGLKPNRICRLGVGRTFQVVRTFARMSVLQNVVVGALVATRSDHEALALARDALERVGLSACADELASTLSNQELRLMELARALASKPRLLLMDETLAGLGRQEVEDMVGVIRLLAQAGTTVVIIDHTMHAMVRLADELLVLDHGRVLDRGAPAQVTRYPAVIEAYLGKKWVAAGAAD